MVDIILIGLNHKTAPVELRECLAFNENDAQTALARLADHPAIGETLLLSTCNRVEILAVSDRPEAAVSAIKTYLHESSAADIEDIDGAIYIHSGDEAVRHMFRVASSLDSMMIGEPQILGQVKSSYRSAIEQKTTGVILNRLMHRTFFVAKRVRSETGIGDHAVSISYAAIELARKIFGDLAGKQVLLIGAGEMAELAVEHLIRHRAAPIYVANRTFERAVALAGRFDGTPIRFEEIPAMMSRVDIVISSTGATETIISRDDVRAAMKTRRNRPIFFIDIAVPRDIDPDVNRLNNAYVYDIDDLNGIVDDNIEDRQREAMKGERIVDEAVIRFRHWLDSLDVVPTIKALRRKIDVIAASELERTLQQANLDESDRQAVERMLQTLINKILHDPTVLLKSDGCQGNRAAYLDMTRKLFNLDPE